ncbi:MAG: hypothetical protein V1926_01100 [Candidatus Peregrinibacteria bacterium]
MKKVCPLAVTLISVTCFLLLLFVGHPTRADAFSFSFVEQENYDSYDQAGLFSGLWHGLIAPYSLIVRLFSPLSSNLSVGMYAFDNTGWFYDLGFLIGIAASWTPVGWIATIVAFIALLL